MMQRVRSAAWLILAGALHLVVLVVLERFAPERTRLAPIGKSARTELAVEIEEAESSGAALATEANPESGVAPAAPSPVARFRPPSRSVDHGAAESERAVTEDPSPVAEGPSPGEEGPVLSLDQLGVGERNPFLRSDLARERPSPGKPRPRPSSQERLDKRLADDQLHADHVRSLGPAGPVLTHLESATRNGEVAVNASALFRCVIDAKGRLVSVTVAESSSDPTPWRRVAKRVAEAMKSHALRVPKTGHGATISIRVTSREALPSGADPGLSVSVLGIPIKEGQGEKSARIDILDVMPKLDVEEVELDSGQVYKVPTIKLPRILSIAADPADIGSPAQRVVHARVESIEAAPKQAER
jgi:hypothetical protein